MRKSHDKYALVKSLHEAGLSYSQIKETMGFKSKGSVQYYLQDHVKAAEPIEYQAHVIVTNNKGMVRRISTPFSSKGELKTNIDVISKQMVSDLSERERMNDE